MISNVDCVCGTISWVKRCRGPSEPERHQGFDDGISDFDQEEDEVGVSLVKAVICAEINIEKTIRAVNTVGKLFAKIKFTKKVCLILLSVVKASFHNPLVFLRRSLLL